LARLYTNENFPYPCAEILRTLGHDVLTVRNSGNSNKGMTDEEVLFFAKNEKRVVVTMNRKHFILLHKKHPDHYGIIVCTYDPDFDGLATRIDDILKSNSNTKAKLFRVNRPNVD